MNFAHRLMPIIPAYQDEDGRLKSAHRKNDEALMSLTLPSKDVFHS